MKQLYGGITIWDEMFIAALGGLVQVNTPEKAAEEAKKYADAAYKVRRESKAERDESYKNKHKTSKHKAHEDDEENEDDEDTE